MFDVVTVMMRFGRTGSLISQVKFNLSDIYENDARYENISSKKIKYNVQQVGAFL